MGGSSGTTGVIGSSGVDGVSGAVGTVGSSGTAGVTGSLGTTGWSGVTGVEGTSRLIAVVLPVKEWGQSPFFHASLRSAAMPPTQRLEVNVDGRTLSLSNLDKVFYPAVGFTKGQVIDYYTRVAPAVLAHLRDRALTLKRYPNGVEGGHFFEKNAPTHRPEWVRTMPINAGGRAGVIEFVVCDDLPTLVWLAQLGDLELHTPMARVTDPGCPTMVVFDLDPGAPATIVECCEVALLLRGMLAGLGLECFPKTSGNKGMQVYVPLNTPGVTHKQAREFAHTVALVLERGHRKLVVSEMKKSLRSGKVFVDYSQNAEYKTTVCVYSLRARERPTASTPLTWDEVEDGLRGGDPAALEFTSAVVLERAAKHGDLFAPVETLEQQLPTG